MDICNHNPAKGIKKNSEKSRHRFLQSDELPRFFDALQQEQNATFRDFVLIALLTGSRRSNVLSMRWSEISFERKEWNIPRTKNDEPQIVVLGDEATYILKQRYNQKSEFVFPGRSKLGQLSSPEKAWAALLKRAGIQNLRMHDLRRTLGSWQAITGASLIVIGKSLGHKSPQATSVYARLDLAPVRKSVANATTAMLHAAGVRMTVSDSTPQLLIE